MKAGIIAFLPSSCHHKVRNIWQYKVYAYIRGLVSSFL